MFAIPGILSLLVFIYVRPHELVGGLLTRVPFMYVSVGLALFGLAVDLKLRLVKPLATPQLIWVILFVLWLFADMAALVPASQIVPRAVPIIVSFLLYVVIAHSVQTFKTLQVLAFTLAAFTLFLTFVGVHQGMSPLGCARMIEITEGMTVADGRPCEIWADCYGADAEPGAIYDCEHVGLFDTTSIKQRVRYIGVLQDPNELAIAMSCGLALLFGIASRRKAVGTYVFTALASVAVLIGLIMTQSRGGQLVFLGVLGVYFLKRYGVKGGVLGAALALPVLLMGGRSDEGADMSTEQRLDAWRDGLNFVKQNPVFGIGHGAFAEHHGRTAHNAYMLAAGELGLLGFFLWTAVIYLSVKVLYQAVREFETVEGAEPARAWGLSLLAAMAGMLTGINFLSFTYHFVLWIYLGLCGAFYSAVKQHRPDWRVRFGLGDAALALAMCLSYLIGMHFFLRAKGF